MKRVLLMSLALVSTATFAQEETSFSQNLKAAFDTSQELNDNIAKTSFTLPVLNPNNCILGSPDSTETTGYCPVPVAAESLVKSIKYVDIGEYDVTVFDILTEAQLYTSGVTGDGTQSVELSQKLDVTAVTQNTFKLFCRNDFNIKTDCGGDVTIFGKLNEATKSFKQTVLNSSLTQVEMAIDGQISNATSTIDQQISKVESLANNALNSAGNNTSALGSLELLVGSNTAGVTSAQADANTALASANSANATASQNSSDIDSLTTVVDKKANSSDLAGKANTVDVDAKLAKKADITYVDGEIAKLVTSQPSVDNCNGPGYRIVRYSGVESCERDPGVPVAVIFFNGQDCPNNVCRINSGYGISSVTLYPDKNNYAYPYRLNFTKEMPDTNYIVNGISSWSGSVSGLVVFERMQIDQFQKKMPRGLDHYDLWTSHTGQGTKHSSENIGVAIWHLDAK